MTLSIQQMNLACFYCTCTTFFVTFKLLQKLFFITAIKCILHCQSSVNKSDWIHLTTKTWENEKKKNSKRCLILSLDLEPWPWTLAWNPDLEPWPWTLTLSLILTMVSTTRQAVLCWMKTVVFFSFIGLMLHMFSVIFVIRSYWRSLKPCGCHGNGAAAPSSLCAALMES